MISKETKITVYSNTERTFSDEFDYIEKYLSGNNVFVPMNHDLYVQCIYWKDGVKRISMIRVIHGNISTMTDHRMDPNIVDTDMKLLDVMYQTHPIVYKIR